MPKGLKRTCCNTAWYEGYWFNPRPPSLHAEVSLSDLLKPKCVISDIVVLTEPVAPSLKAGLVGDFSNTSHEKKKETSFCN